MDVRSNVRSMVDRLGPHDCEAVQQFIRNLDDNRIGMRAEPARECAADAAISLGSTTRRGPEPVTLDNIEACFTYQNADRAQLEQFAQVREALITAGKVLLRLVPDCPDQLQAMACLRMARMWANSAISFRGRF